MLFIIGESDAFVGVNPCEIYALYFGIALSVKDVPTLDELVVGEMLFKFFCHFKMSRYSQSFLSINWLFSVDWRCFFKCLNLSAFLINHLLTRTMEAWCGIRVLGAFLFLRSFFLYILL